MKRVNCNRPFSEREVDVDPRSVVESVPARRRSGVPATLLYLDCGAVELVEGRVDWYERAFAKMRRAEVDRVHEAALAEAAAESAELLGAADAALEEAADAAPVDDGADVPGPAGGPLRGRPVREGSGPWLCELGFGAAGAAGDVVLVETKGGAVLRKRLGVLLGYGPGGAERWFAEFDRAA